MSIRPVAGVEGCRGGWISVAALESRPLWVFVAKTNDALATDLPDDSLIGIDVPIGLPNHDSRLAEGAARAMLGRRKSSVFPVPLRIALNANTREEACDLQAAEHARGLRIGVQTWAIAPKIREVDRYLREDVRRVSRLVEVHPEVSFCYWNERVPLVHSKKTGPGKRQRAALIDATWPNERLRLQEYLLSRDTGEWAVDGFYDAFAALWTARRHTVGSSQPHPDPHEVDSEGLPMRIVA